MLCVLCSIIYLVCTMYIVQPHSVQYTYLQITKYMGWYFVPARLMSEYVTRITTSTRLHATKPNIRPATNSNRSSTVYARVVN